MLQYSGVSCSKFTEELFSKSPVPGGGGAAALIGAIGTALTGMVGNLTIGKKKYAEYERQIGQILEKAEKIRTDMIGMIDLDAECFLPLAQVYGIKAVTEEEIRNKEAVLEKALKTACRVPVDIVKAAYSSLKLHEELVNICTKLAISDIGVGVQCLRASLLGGYLNVLINLKMIKDMEYVDKTQKELQVLVRDGVRIADAVYEKVIKDIS